MRLKWKAFNNKARALSSYATIFNNNLDFILTDYAEDKNYELTEFKNWPSRTVV